LHHARKADLLVPVPCALRRPLAAPRGIADDAGNQPANPSQPMTPTLTALAGFVAWSLFLLVLMEAIRAWLVLTRVVPANGFDPANSGLSPFMQRLARAHANCIEGLPIFGGLLVIAEVAGKSALTDPLAYVFLAARIVQSLVHLASVSAPAVTLRFSAFAVQMAIGVAWAVRLLGA
jgi:uncharacterized MAPEG superfamily protein